MHEEGPRCVREMRERRKSTFLPLLPPPATPSLPNRNHWSYQSTLKSWGEREDWGPEGCREAFLTFKRKMTNNMCWWMPLGSLLGTSKSESFFKSKKTNLRAKDEMILSIPQRWNLGPCHQYTFVSRSSQSPGTRTSVPITSCFLVVSFVVPLRQCGGWELK